jgi:hypothetical protein
MRQSSGHVGDQCQIRCASICRNNLQRLSMVLLVAFGEIAASLVGCSASGAASPTSTVSHYEGNTNAGAFYAQGQVAGESGSQGLVILDFGRPAADGSASGIVDFSGNFDSFVSVDAAAESYIQGYFASAPSELRLDVAIGTNDSCGSGQPCGDFVCGCEFEPASFAAWGALQAAAVEGVQSQTNSLKSRSGYTDTVTVFAGDDAEPAFDPTYQNTYNLMLGYSTAVGGYMPAMIDYGSADPGFWTSGQLLQIADGFVPNVAVPEIYSGTDALQWASLASYAKTVGKPLKIFGVLTTSPVGAVPQTSYGSLVSALQPITGQTSIDWLSNINS